MDWTQKVCLDLITWFHHYEVLWNPDQENYYNSLEKNKAWAEIAEQVEHNVEDCKKKLDSLKGSYRREKSRSRKMAKTGEVYRSKWFAFKSLKFLDEKTKNEKKTFPKEILDENETETDNFIWELGSTEAQEDTIIKAEFKSKATARSGPNKRSRFQDEPRTNEVYLKEFVGLTENDSPRDECSAFAQYVEAKLRKLDEQHQNIAQHRISNVLYEIEMSLYANNPNTSTVTSVTCPLDE